MVHVNLTLKQIEKILKHLKPSSKLAVYLNEIRDQELPIEEARQAIFEKLREKGIDYAPVAELEKEKGAVLHFRIPVGEYHTDMHLGYNTQTKEVYKYISKISEEW